MPAILSEFSIARFLIKFPCFSDLMSGMRKKTGYPYGRIFKVFSTEKRGKHKTRPHFLGAVVLEQLNNASGSIEARQVIDGQQRFTTLQLFMIATRDVCKQVENEKYFERFNDLVTNKASKVDHSYEAYKIWPTNSDRKAFELVHKSYSPSAVDNSVKEHPELERESHQIIKGYKFFHRQLNKWFDEMLVDGHSLDDCLDVLWQVMRNHLQLVVIDLDSEDESQVIFETLNARGTQLLPADLIKNYLFRRGQVSGADTEFLYQNHWREFDSRHWRTEVKQGSRKTASYRSFLTTLFDINDARRGQGFPSI